MPNNTVGLSGDNRIDSLLYGAKWQQDAAGTAATVTYSFPSGSAYWAYTDEVNAGWYGLSSAQQINFANALTQWSEVSGLTFTNVSDSITYGDIRVAYSHLVTGSTEASTYGANTGTLADGVITPSAQAGDIWLNPSEADLTTDTDGFLTLMHEIGHAIGLKDSSTADGSFPVITAGFDSTQYTVMSTTNFTGAGYRFSSTGTPSLILPTTLMPYDILAIQYLYGADTDTRTTNDTYTFATTAEVKTIWDAGGTDTIDLSNQTIGAELNLTAGSFSDIGQRQLEYNGAYSLAQENIAIAFNVEIENAIGSSHNDKITGNSADNELTGGAGNDTLDGGDGIDTAIYSAAQSEYQLVNSGGNLVISGIDGTDTLSNIEKLSFNGTVVEVSSLTIADGDILTALPTTKSEVNFTPTEAETAYFLLELSAPLSTAASVSYRTADGTAIAGSDYVETNGTATLSPGQTFLAIGVDLIDDTAVENNETFSLIISNPVGGSFINNEIELVAQRIILDNDA